MQHVLGRRNEKILNTLTGNALRNHLNTIPVSIGLNSIRLKPMHLNYIAMAIIKAGVANLNPRSLFLFTSKLINRMTGNPRFTDPQPALADIQTKLDEFEALAITAEDGTKRDRVARDTSGKELKEMLRVLANYVAMVAAGDANTILSSGFDIRNEAEPAPPVTNPAALKAVRSSISGIVELDWEPVTSALNYRVMMTTSDPNLVEAEWTSVTITSKSKAEINNLTAGQYYWFKVQAIGRSGMSGYSDPATVMAA